MIIKIPMLLSFKYKQATFVFLKYLYNIFFIWYKIIDNSKLKIEGNSNIPIN